jgi:predicted transcriptional regulator
MWVKYGMTEKEIAKNLGISYASFKNYKKSHLALFSSCKNTKSLTDAKVVESLLKNATGYTYKEQQAFKVKVEYYDDQGRKCYKEQIEVVDIEKHKGPETQASEFWIINRDPDKWATNPHAVKAKEDELALREKELESKAW